MDSYSDDLEHLIEVAKDTVEELVAFGDGEFSLEIWKKDKDGLWGNSGKPIWRKEVTAHNKIRESKEKTKGKVNRKNLTDYIVDYEGGEISEEDMLDLFQYLVDSGMAWTLQGHYGRTAASLIEAGLIHESTNKGDKMLTEKKKLPIMIQRLKKWKKWKGISKEDIMKYGTRDEVKLLEEDDPFEIPLGDEQDQSLPEEEISLEDEQEAGSKPSEDYASEYGLGEFLIPEDLIQRIYYFIDDTAKESEEREELLNELAEILGEKNEKELGGE
jgi:hypothetical protein